MIYKKDHFNLHYVIEGKGHPTLVIGSHLYYPRTFSQNLRKHLRLIFTDHRGFCPTDERDTKDDFSLSNLISDIHALQEELGYEKIILIGHSIHALIALEYAKKYPEKVSKLILIATSPISGPKLHQAANRAFEESVCPDRKELLSQNMKTLEEKITKDPDQAFITRMLSFGPMLWYDPFFDARALWEGVTFNKTGAAVIWGEMFDSYDVMQNIENIACPVFLGLGRYDFFNPPYLWESMRPYVKDLTVRIFEKSGHTPQLEEAELFDQEVYNFIQKP